MKRRLKMKAAMYLRKLKKVVAMKRRLKKKEALKLRKLKMKGALKLRNLKKNVAIKKWLKMKVVKTLFLVVLLGGTLTRVRCLRFNYTGFDTIYPESGSGYLIMSNYSHIEFGAIQVTPDVTGAIPNYSGRVFYNNTFRLWNKNSGVTANFNTTFVLNISPKTSPGGEGLSFILAADTTPPQNSDGQWLGIVNASTNGSSQAKVVAVEFDTRKSYQEDLDDNHVGLDVNTIYSEPQVPLTNLVFSWQLNLSYYLPEDVYVGFSASTGNDTELNCIWSWEFNAPAAVVLVLSGIVFYLYWRRKQALYAEDPYPGLEDQIRGSSTAPQKFLLKELRKATGNFNPKNKLGKGGFGTVYKGLLANKEVAVKRVSKNSSQGKQEFIAEVTTIGSLYHKNLVRLIGWCYERRELLLVYEFMPNGSLDKFIFGNEKLGTEEPTLTWEKRHIIIHGVAEALDYLHNGCENRVLHRDIKASNIMLDSEYNAKLGDFGLARTIQQRGKTHHSTIEIAGTPGYMAPETFHISRATVETDVYSFGVLVLEVLCGRKPGNQTEENNYNSSIVYWLWELHRNGRILDAVDSRLNMEFDEERMSCMLVLALLCCHPNPHQRPSMKTVLQVLTGEAPPPLVPTEIPAFVWPAMPPSFKGDSGNSLCESKSSPFTELTGR
nr:putative l-type lectin-domain containing receptor kinase s.5 [Quercus suber]